MKDLNYHMPACLPSQNNFIKQSLSLKLNNRKNGVSQNYFIVQSKNYLFKV